MISRLSESTILRLIVLLPIIAVMLTSIILTNIFISAEKTSFKTEIESIEEQHIKSLKSLIKDRIDKISELIKIKNESHMSDTKEELRNFVEMGYKIIESSHVEYQGMPDDAIVEEIKHHLRKVRFYDNQSGYFFIYTLKGVNVLLPIKPELEGKNMMNIQDVTTGRYLIQEALKKLSKNDTVYTTYFWPKGKDKEVVEKLSYYKKYEPLQLFIGTGKYFDDIYKENINTTLALLESIEYADDNYVFAINDEGTAVVHPNKNIHNKRFEQLQDIEKKIVTNILKQREHKDGAYIEYKPTTQKNDEKPSHKISFVKYIPELKLTIGTGLYTDELHEKVSEKQALLKNKLNDTTNKIIVSAFLVTIFLVLLMVIVSSAIKDILNRYAKQLANKNQDLKNLNNSLEKRVRLEVEKNRKQDEILNQQSKMAAMGEMLGNISHQWRQPLTAISTSASGLKFQDDMGLLEKEEMHKGLEGIVKNTKLLSETIDDFRNFFNPNKSISLFNIQDCFDKVFVLVSANLKNKNIEVIKNINDVELFSHKNELIQALLNLINNAKDALESIENDDRYIIINTTEKDDTIIITIQDSAQGIKPKILNRIFEPYFTTKHQTHGTGIGLYMTQKIIQTNLHGTISIENSSFNYQGKTYKGALCTIKLPKMLKKETLQ